jgi:uncharacterized protein
LEEIMRKRLNKSLVAVAVTLLAAGAASAQQLRMMTGPQGGSWYPLGGAIQNIVERNVPGVGVQVLPGAGISNVKGVDEGKADLGFGNAVSTVDGVNGQAPFDAVTANVCHVGTLYFQYFHLVALADSGIKDPADLAGKGLTTQQRGNTGEQMTRAVLEVYGLGYDKMGKVSHGSYNDSVAQLKDNQAQVFSLITTVPASSVMDLASARDITVLEIPTRSSPPCSRSTAATTSASSRPAATPSRTRTCRPSGPGPTSSRAAICPGTPSTRSPRRWRRTSTTSAPWCRR